MMKADIVRRLKFNKFNLFVMLAIALLAALSTVFFAFSAGISGTWTVILRMAFSFVLFAAVGFLFADFLEREYLGAFSALKEKAVGGEDAKESQGAAAGDMNSDNAYDDSFDKIVVADKKSE
ncbi:MAG: hypothetical protein LBO03_08740 [Acidaminococcales bacterium]|jgi:hypothetical protein|nr:hypothetical protein [Acidaminococcales bacterium]